jgi:hypothetical protein
MAAIVACLAVTAIFSGCEEEDEPQSGDKQIITFCFAELSVYGYIDEDAKTISVEVSKGTDVTALVPEIDVSDDATVSPASGVAQNFTNPVIYTVTAKNGSTAKYTVTVTVNDNFYEFWYKLPENVSIEFFERDDYLTVTYTFIKVGNNYFYEDNLGDLACNQRYLKYNNGVWSEYAKKILAGITTLPWTLAGTKDDPDWIHEIVVRGYLSFVAAYDDIDLDKRATNLGNEMIAGVQTTKYRYGVYTFNRIPEFNLFFKKTNDPGGEFNLHYEVTKWDTTVTGFGDIDLP